MEWEKLKSEGNDLLKDGDSEGATNKYTEAIALCGEDDVSNVQLLYSNRSAAYLKSGDVEKSLQDAEHCVKIAPTWAKGYSRKAAVLKEMKRYEEAKMAAEEGLQLEPTNVALKTTKKFCDTQQVVEKLRGVWHGVVADDVGGYMQSFDFQNESDVHVSVLGTQVEAKYELNVYGTPYPHLDMSVPSAVNSAFVRHIYKFVGDDELHLCSPYLRPPEERPTEFVGAGMVIMKRGAFTLSPEAQKAKDEIMAQPLQMRVESFLENCVEAVPSFDVRPVEGETDAEIGRKLTANVKFQTFYQALIEKYGPETEQYVKELVIGMKNLSTEEEKIRDLVIAFQSKMHASGLMSDGEAPPPSTATKTVTADEILTDKELRSKFISGADEPLVELEPSTTKVESPVVVKKVVKSSVVSSSKASTPAPSTDYWIPIAVASLAVVTAVVAVVLLGGKSSSSSREN
jgi:tetratricopeptide (TPR) repeat protein